MVFILRTCLYDDITSQRDVHVSKHCIKDTVSICKSELCTDYTHADSVVRLYRLRNHHLRHTYKVEKNDFFRCVRDVFK